MEIDYRLWIKSFIFSSFLQRSVCLVNLMESCGVVVWFIFRVEFVMHRQNAIRLAEKEKIEKELLNQIIDEADEYKVDFYRRRKITCENNIATNREKEKVCRYLQYPT